MALTSQQFIDAQPTTRRQRLIVFVLFLVMVMQGMNEVAIAQLWGTLVSPTEAGGWGMPFEAVTAIVTLSTIAIAIGAIIAGVTADRIGRKNTLLAGLVWLIVFAAALSFAPDILAFGILRVISCVGLGAVFVTSLAYIGDLTRHASRPRLTTIVAAGAGTGGVVSAILAAALLSDAGWRTILLIVSLLPIIVIPIVVTLVPESPGLLVLRQKSPEKVQRALRKLFPTQDLSTVDLVTPTHSEEEASGPVSTLFTRELIGRTLLLWALFIAYFATLNFVLQYIPVLLEHHAPEGPGFSAEQASTIFALFAMGGVIGALIIAAAVGRRSPFVVISISWTIAIVLLIVIVLTPPSFEIYLILFGLLGASLIGGTAAAVIFPVLTYPLAARGTGTGAATGVGGGVGTTLGGLAGGALIGTGIGTSAVFVVLIAPIALGVALLTILGVVTARTRRPQEPVPVPSSTIG